MSTTTLSPELRKRYFDANGLPLSGGLLYSYQAGTTTPQATFTDQGGLTPNANPIVLDANGYADMWLDPTLSYKFALYDSSSVLQWTVDNVVGQLTADAVGTSTIQDGAVTGPKIAAGAITPDKVNDQLFGPTKLLNYSLLASVTSNELTITLRDGTGAAPSALSAIAVAFRNGTATTGTPVYRTTTSALTMTLSNGSTVGAVDGQPSYVYVYLLDNAGTLEMAVSGSGNHERAALLTTTQEDGAGGADDGTLLYANNVRTNVAVRLIGRVRSTQATAGVWATAPSEISLIPFVISQFPSEIWVQDSVGNGSGPSIKIPQYTNLRVNRGTDITYVPDAVNGDKFIINTDGVYALQNVDYFTAPKDFGITLNSPDITTNIVTLRSTNPEAILGSGTVAGTNFSDCIAVTLFLYAGSIIRSQNDGGATSAPSPMFRITKLF